MTICMIMLEINSKVMTVNMHSNKQHFLLMKDIVLILSQLFIQKVLEELFTYKKLVWHYRRLELIYFEYLFLHRRPIQ